MATSAYKYKDFETLVTIANQFNTDVSTLVRLNTWLRDPNSGKTHMNPNVSTTSQNLDIDTATSLAFSFTVSPKKYTVYAKVVTIDGQTIVYHEDNDRLVPSSADNVCLGQIDYRLSIFRIEDSLSNFKSITLIYDQDYWPDYLVLPLISNGSSSMEDYWKQMTSATGIQYDSMLENFATSQSSYKNISKLDELDVDYSESDGASPVDGTKLINDFQPNMSYNLGRLSDAFIKDELKNVSHVLAAANVDNGGEFGIFDTGYSQVANNSPLYNGTDLNISKFTNQLNTAIGNSVTNNIGKKLINSKEIKFDAYSNTKMIIQVGENTIYLPVVPDSISDSVSANYSSEPVLGSSEPYTIYNNTSPRALQFQVTLHRDMSTSKDDDILEKIAGIIQSGVYPSYTKSEVASLKTQVKVLNQVYISGIMVDASVEFSGPIRTNVSGASLPNWMTGKYTVLTVSFKVQEVNKTFKGAKDVLTRFSKLNAPDKFNKSSSSGLKTNI